MAAINAPGPGGAERVNRDPFGAVEVDTWRKVSVEVDTWRKVSVEAWTPRDPLIVAHLPRWPRQSVAVAVRRVRVEVDGSYSSADPHVTVWVDGFEVDAHSVYTLPSNSAVLREWQWPAELDPLVREAFVQYRARIDAGAKVQTRPTPEGEASAPSTE